MIGIVDKPVKICRQNLIIVLLLTYSTYADVLLEKVLFQKYDNGYNAYRIPALYYTDNGVLLAFAEARKNSPSDTGDIDTVLRRSLDGGITWLPMQMVWDDGPNTCGNPTIVQDDTNGRLWLFLTHNLGQDTQAEIQDGTSDGVRTIWSCYSDDDGAAWSTPVNRFSQVQPSTIRWDATGPGRGIQLQNGIRAGRLIIPANGRNIHSDDNGLTWQQSTWLPSGSSESQIVELQHGTLLRNDRASTKYKDLNARVLCFSYNQGSNWTSLQLRTDLTCPICQGSMIAVPEPSGPFGRLLVFSNPSAKTRVNMTVQYSYDEGTSWPVKKMIYPDGSAYSCLTPIGDDHLGLLYENGDSSQLYRRITFAKFSRQWVRDKAVVTWDFEELLPGQMISTDSGAVKDKRGYGLDATAQQNFQVVPAGILGQKSAVRFTGGGTGIRISDSEARKIINFKADESFCARVIFRTVSHCTGGVSGTGALVSKDVGPNSKSWWLRVQDGKLRFLVNDGPVTVSVWSVSTVCDGAWYEVMAVRDAASRTLKMYVNGILENEIADTTTEGFENTNAVSVGCFNTAAASFIGDIARIQLYRTNAAQVVSFFEGDLDFNHKVDIFDLALMSRRWLEENSPEMTDGDLDQNGSINGTDFLKISKNWLRDEYK
jgi:hypothetical protein